MKYIALTILIGSALQVSAFNLQETINNAKTGDTITIPSGVYTEPITVSKGITLKGDGAILEVKSDKPALMIDCFKPVTIEGLTIKWELQNKEAKNTEPYALFIPGGKVTIRNCTFIDLSKTKPSPVAISARNRSKVTIENCRFNRFEYTVQYWDGAEGTISDCIVLNSGHCGISIGHESHVDVTRNIVSGSLYHGIRFTGSEFTADSNLIIRNKNRGFYIGNVPAEGTLSNNLIVDNSSGISLYATSEVEMNNNVILRSGYAGIAAEETVDLKMNHNIVADNTRGFMGFSSKKGDRSSLRIKGQNISFENATLSEQVKFSSDPIEKDPTLSNPDEGLFQSGIKGYGLSDPKTIQQLWIKWKEATDA